LSEGNRQNKKKKLDDSSYRFGSRARISAEDLKNLRRSQRLPFEPPSSPTTPQKPKEKAKEQEK
jgi:hypothetical protein